MLERKDRSLELQAGNFAMKGTFFLWIWKGCLFIGIPVWLFFQNIVFVLIGFLFLPIYIRREKEKKREEEKQKLNRGFADALASFAAALEAGYSAENAWEESIYDLALYSKKEDSIQREFRHVQHRLRNNQSLESALSEMALRTGDEDISVFAQVFSIAKRSGGDLIKVIKATERNIVERAEVKREIHTILTAKRLEANIMNLMPCGILAYFLVCDPNYLSPIYEGLAGRLIMAGLLLVYLACIYASSRITKIEI